ncbi:MAG: hypothetical protein GXP37_13690 [Chloroflexi bacterium]|nr:hypothetical protein [Chloroflexota bacterium]
MSDRNMKDVAQRAGAVRTQLQALWADEGVDQLSIFLDPGIVSVLEEIKRVSLAFVDEIAALDES